jgi:kynurenine formamidase
MLIDVSLPIKGGAVFRLGTPPVEITTQTFFHESEGEYESTVISLPAHTATHIDLVSKDKRLDPERMIGKGKLIDVSQMSHYEIQLEDVEHQAHIESGDFVFIRTDWSKFVGSRRYYDHPTVSLDVVQWLVSKRINVVGIDAIGLGHGHTHGEYDRLLIRNDIFILENLTNLSAIPQKEFTTYCFPLRIENIDAIPARVIVEIDGSG